MIRIRARWAGHEGVHALRGGLASDFCCLSVIGDQDSLLVTEINTDRKVFDQLVVQLVGDGLAGWNVQFD